MSTELPADIQASIDGANAAVDRLIAERDRAKTAVVMHQREQDAIKEALKIINPAQAVIAIERIVYTGI